MSVLQEGGRCFAKSARKGANVLSSTVSWRGALNTVFAVDAVNHFLESSVFDETPDISSLLLQQLSVAVTVARENTGWGFLTTMAVPSDAPNVSGRSVLGYETEACIDGLVHGLGFALVLKEGRLHVLDGYSKGGENTRALDFERLGFTISKAPFND